MLNTKPIKRFYYNFEKSTLKKRKKLSRNWKNYIKSSLVTRKSLAILVAISPLFASFYIVFFTSSSEVVIEVENEKTTRNVIFSDNLVDAPIEGVASDNLEDDSRYNIIVAPDGTLIDLNNKIVKPEIGREYHLNISNLQHEETLSEIFENEGLHIYDASFFDVNNIERVNEDDGPIRGFIADTPDESNNEYKVKRKIIVPTTAYSSTEDQTDSTPFITAFNTNVYWGVVAANFLPYGTKLRIPAYYGDKIFTVEDRMHERYPYRIDIWMGSRPEAKNFGIRNVEVEILRKVK